MNDNLADITFSDNYRGIASGSLILKLLVILILDGDGDKLSGEQLQFIFHAGASTSLCSCTAATCAMDLSKAFDLVEWKSLSQLLWKRKVSPIVLRLLLHVYCNQHGDVKWNSFFKEISSDQQCMSRCC